jgi:hypothetical protein
VFCLPLYARADALSIAEEKREMLEIKGLAGSRQRRYNQYNNDKEGQE